MDRHYFGLYPALVSDLVDPDHLGRVQVRFPWLGEAGQDVRAWATLLSPYADDDQGLLALPEVDSQVVVGFEAGDLRRPYVVGACWNGREVLPVSPTRPNNKRVLQSRSKSLLEFDDGPEGPKVTVKTRGGNQVVLDEAVQQVEISHLNGAKIVINAAGQVSITANATVEVTAAAVNVHAAAAVFDGMITCTNLIASVGVVSPSYTPGAGNIW